MASKFKQAGVTRRLVEGFPNLDVEYMIAQGLADHNKNRTEPVTVADVEAELKRLRGLKAETPVVKFAKALPEIVKDQTNQKGKAVAAEYVAAQVARIANYTNGELGLKTASKKPAAKKATAPKTTGTKAAPSGTSAKKPTMKKPDQPVATEKKTAVASKKSGSRKSTAKVK